MTEIPEHLLKRAAAARDKAKVEPAPAAEEAAGRLADSRAPAQAESGGESVEGCPLQPSPEVALPLPTRSAPVVAAGPAEGGVPVGGGPGGHTQRLLTVVKSGTIQDVKAVPVDKVHTWPHLLAAEFVAALACTALTFVFSIFVNAPLLELANTNADTEPVEGPLVLPRPAGTADDVPPDGGGCDTARCRHHLS